MLNVNFYFRRFCFQSTLKYLLCYYTAIKFELVDMCFVMFDFSEQKRLAKEAAKDAAKEIKKANQPIKVHTRT